MEALILVGLSHRTAKLAVRERYSISVADLPACLESVKDIEGVEEVFAISTCNRTEILVVAKAAANPVDAIVAKVFRNIEGSSFYVFQGVQTVIHLFRLAAGLDSLVLGESEILAQIKRSIEVAEERGVLGSELQPLLRQALSVGKRVRSETEIGRGTLSVARVGVDVASRIFGDFKSCRALIIGAGETGMLVARHLIDLEVAHLAFANRTLERAQTAAIQFDAQAHGLDELAELIPAVDVIVTCIDGTTIVVDNTCIDRRRLRRRDRPLLIVDLSVPRAVDSSLGQLENLLLYDLDDLERVVEDNRREREEASALTGGILVGEVHKYLSLRTFASFSPAIERLRERFSSVREEVVDLVCGETTDPEQVQLAHELERRLLDVALTQMKESARNTSSEAALDQAYQRFLENL